MSVRPILQACSRVTGQMPELSCLDQAAAGIQGSPAPAQLLARPDPSTGNRHTIASR
jgi:hypothetical protein